jgi:thioredoxin
MTWSRAAVYRRAMKLPRFIVRLFAAMGPRTWISLVIVAVVAAGVVMVQRSSDGDDAFYRRWGVDPSHPPYQSDVDPRAAVDLGKARAADSGKMLMVTFGANWCPDCLTLQRNLRDPQTREYVQRNFEIVNIDVGDSAKNARVEHNLGMLINTIPLAVFYSSDGKPICDTGRGELEPSRHYTSREILAFLREVVDHHRVVSPDQRQ